MSSQPDQEKVMSDSQMESSGIPPTESEKDSTSTTETSGGHSVDVIAIPANRVTVYWPHAREHVMRAFDRYPGEMSEGDLITRLLAGEMLLWVASSDKIVGGAITEICNYSDFSAVRIVALGGINITDEFLPLLKRFADVWNCRRVEFYGRKGWERKAPDFKVDKIMMILELKNG